jgi:hypothetical protein
MIAAKPERTEIVTQTASVRGMLDVINAIKCRDVFTDNGGAYGASLLD